ncbi:MAG: ClpXP protease specificity-enhancing factor [Gammaproteobacteria bacterium]|nr:ClpXP protease specificity-enhancing factor [Gammaproteobacteria bacterium]
MTPNRPYLIRAFYDWIVDNDMTPFILVRADEAGVILPPNVADSEHRVYLNVSPTACANIDLGNAAVAFSARFSGVSFDCYIPVASVKAIYARENGRGMVFPDMEEGDEQPTPPDNEPPSTQPEKKRPSLKVVK